MKFQKGNEGPSPVQLSIKNIPKKLDEFLNEYIKNLTDKSITVEDAREIWVNMWENERTIMKKFIPIHILDEMNEIYDVFINTLRQMNFVTVFFRVIIEYVSVTIEGLKSEA